jgi:hypothetical protein
MAMQIIAATAIVIIVAIERIAGVCRETEAVSVFGASPRVSAAPK